MYFPINSLSKILSEWLLLNGDHSFWGWVITFFYIITTVASFYYVKILHTHKNKEKRILWIFLGIFLVFMGINKQLDLQLLLAVLGRYIGRKYGFLGIRRTLQTYFVITLFLIVFSVGGIIAYRIRKILKECWIELIGVSIIMIFFLIQTASMTHFKIIIKFDEVNIPHIHALELLGLILILGGIIYYIHRENNQKQKELIDRNH